MEDIICKQCGSINDYKVERKAHNDVATCNGCGAFIKNIPYAEPALYFGKFKGKPIKDFVTPDEIRYLYWVRNNPDIWTKLTVRVQQAINLRLDGHL